MARKFNIALQQTAYSRIYFEAGEFGKFSSSQSVKGEFVFPAGMQEGYHTPVTREKVLEISWEGSYPTEFEMESIIEKILNSKGLVDACSDALFYGEYGASVIQTKDFIHKAEMPFSWVTEEEEIHRWAKVQELKAESCGYSQSQFMFFFTGGEEQ